MKKRVLLLSIDGLGVGETPDVRFVRKSDIGANTLNSIMKTGLKLNFLNKINLLSLDDEYRSLSYKDFNINSGKSLLGYNGADSYLGHAEMIGREINIKEVFLDDYKFLLKEELFKHYNYEVDVKNGYLLINNYVIISNNMECDAGYSLNIIIENKYKNY